MLQQKRAVLGKRRGLTIKQLAETMTNLSQQGHGDVMVYLPAMEDQKRLAKPVWRGDLALTSDGDRVLVLQPSDDFTAPLSEAMP